jgi:cell division protein FtsL
MNKIFVITLILSLILLTAFIKNSTKKIEDDILVKRENLQDLKKELGDSKLEFHYLSSAQKLLEYQSLYFEQDLIQKDINQIKILEKTLQGIKLKKLKFTSINE